MAEHAPSYGTLTPRDERILRDSASRRRRLSVLAMVLGLGSVVLSLTIVLFAYLQLREDAERKYLQNTITEVQFVAATIALRQDGPPPQVLAAVKDLWDANSRRKAPDEHLLVVDGNSRVVFNNGVIFDTTLSDTAERDDASGDEALTPEEKQQQQNQQETIINVRERLGLLQGRYSGEFPDFNREMLLGSFIDAPQRNFPQRRWFVGIFRSRAGLHAEAAHLGFSNFGTLILACGLGIPISLVLTYSCYRLAHRDQLIAEEQVARIAAIVEHTDDAIFSQSFDGLITSWNRGAEQLFGVAERDAIGRSSAALIPSEQIGEEQRLIEDIRRNKQVQVHTLESTRTRSDGRPIQVSQTVSAIRDARGRHVGVSIIARDVTERKDLEREVLESTRREQHRIGRELHDSLGQELTGLSYLAKSLSQKLGGTGNPHGEAAGTISTGIQRAIGAVRSAVQGLRPVEVDASGLMVAIEKLAADTAARCDIDCRVERADPIAVDDNDVATHLYRIVQEAINNAVKHSRAARIVVRPRMANGVLSIAIEDDGVGINGAAHTSANGHEGMGLRIMRYRAGVIGATLDVETVPGSGTSVVCRIKNSETVAE